MEEKIARLKEELREILYSCGYRYYRNPAAESDEPLPEDGMTAEREGRILEGAVAKWGPDLQTDVAIEEMCELIQAIAKYRRALAGFKWYDQALEPVRQHIREEMADVSIMLRQLELIYGGYADEEIRKLERLERRLQE